MIFDYNTAHTGAVIETDLCIIGAGAAGITIAREFVDTPVRVCLIESGSDEIDYETQVLYQGENIGRDYYDLDVSRLRFFGGTTNHWGGRSRPLAEIDFQKRDWVPFSGWPINLSDVEPFYPRAHDICRIGPYFQYGTDVWDLIGVAPPAFDSEELTSIFWQYSRTYDADIDDYRPVSFGRDYRSVLKEAENLDVFLNANLTDIRLTDNAAAVNYVEIRSLSGKSAVVKARVIVLACGAIEIPRILLSSNNVETAGVGNRYDLVGRFFMEHPDVKCGTAVSTRPVDELNAFHRKILGSAAFQPGFLAGPEAQKGKRFCIVPQQFVRRSTDRRQLPCGNYTAT